MPIDAPADSPVVDPIILAPVERLLLTPSECAAALRISPRLLWARTKIGEIPCIRIGKCVRYDPRALLKFLDTAK